MRGSIQIPNRTESRDYLQPSRRDVMNSKAPKLLLVESDDALREQIVAVLREAGYAVSTDYQQGMKAVLAFDPDAVVLGASSQLDCCDLLSEIKGSEQTHNIRVVMLSPGGSAERTRGLDLGADDVLSLPFDAHELLSRASSQLRNKSVADGFRERLRFAEENRNATQQGGDRGQRRTANAAGGQADSHCRACGRRAGLLLFVSPQPTTEYPGLRCDHSIANRHADATTVDGKLRPRS